MLLRTDWLAVARAAAPKAARAIVEFERAVGGAAPPEAAVAEAWRALVDRVEGDAFDLSEATCLALYAPLVEAPFAAFAPGRPPCTTWAEFLAELLPSGDPDDAIDDATFVLAQLGHGEYVPSDAATLGWLAANGVLLAAGCPAVWPDDDMVEPFAWAGPDCWDGASLSSRVYAKVRRATA